MQRTRIALVSLGSLKYPVDIASLEKWPSEIMTIRHAASIGLLPNAAGDNWEYTKAQLSKIVQRDEQSEITVALINAPLENNYYMHRLGDNVAVLSLYEMAEIIRISHFTLEDYILRNLYELLVLFAAHARERAIPSNAYTWAHDEVRGCLFDKNASKPDIVFSMHRPTLCHDCRNRLLAAQVDSKFIPALEKELTQIRRALFYRIEMWIKGHPLWALAIAATASVVLNLIASVLFEGAKKLLQ